MATFAKKIELKSASGDIMQSPEIIAYAPNPNRLCFKDELLFAQNFIGFKKYSNDGPHNVTLTNQLQKIPYSVPKFCCLPFNDGYKYNPRIFNKVNMFPLAAFRRIAKINKIKGRSKMTKEQIYHALLKL